MLALPKPFPLDSFVDCVDRLLQRSLATTGGTVNFLRRALPYLTVALVIAIAYDGWIFYSLEWTRAKLERRRR